MLKRIITSLFCLFLIFASIPIFGFTGSFIVPVYADDTLDSWRDATTNEEFAEAFRYYCKSRDLTIDGTVANVLTNGTTNIFNALCDGIGINVTALQGHIKYEVDSSGNKGLKWLFDSQGITFYNRLFAQFLQDNDLSVGDTVENIDLYSGKYLEGSNTLLYTFNGSDSTSSNGGQVVSKGMPYIYDLSDYKNMANSTSFETSSVLFGSTYRLVIERTRYSDIYMKVYKDGASRYLFESCVYDPSGGTDRQVGVPALGYNLYDGCIYYGCYKSRIANADANMFSDGYKISDSNNGAINANIYITTNNTIINNNTYEGDTIINNDGDIVNPPIETPPGGTDPGWNVSGGQGSSGDTIINFPDFQLPDLNIDWSIKGLGNKFPFSIPFDIASLVTVLNAEPEAPRFQGTVNFGFTTWNYDINLQQFDSVAHACRIAELLLLVFGLILITRSIIKG